MEKSKWFRWLSATTHETSSRGIARKVGVAHTTVQRWATNGMTADKVWELTRRFHGDPIAALVLLSRVDDADIPDLNWAAVVKYVPIDVLADEIAARIAEGARRYPREAESLQKRTTRV